MLIFIIIYIFIADAESDCRIVDSEQRHLERLQVGNRKTVNIYIYIYNIYIFVFVLF